MVAVHLKTYLRCSVYLIIRTESSIDPFYIESGWNTRSYGSEWFLTEDVVSHTGDNPIRAAFLRLGWCCMSTTVNGKELSYVNPRDRLLTIISKLSWGPVRCSTDSSLVGNHYQTTFIEQTHSQLNRWWRHLALDDVCWQRTGHQCCWRTQVICLASKPALCQLPIFRALCFRLY
jgi:hypothetical protein